MINGLGDWKKWARGENCATRCYCLMLIILCCSHSHICVSSEFYRPSASSLWLCMFLCVNSCETPHIWGHSSHPFSLMVSYSSMFRRSYVQKVLCLEGSMFRRSFVQKVLCLEGSMFRRSFVQKFLCSEGSMFRRFYIQKVLCLEGPMFRRSYV